MRARHCCETITLIPSRNSTCLVLRAAWLHVSQPHDTCSACLRCAGIHLARPHPQWRGPYLGTPAIVWTGDMSLPLACSRVAQDSRHGAPGPSVPAPPVTVASSPAAHCVRMQTMQSESMQPTTRPVQPLAAQRPAAMQPRTCQPTASAAARRTRTASQMAQPA